MKKLFLAFVIIGAVVAAYGLYKSNLINEKAIHMGYKTPVNGAQTELCLKAGCYYVSVEDKISHEKGLMIAAIGVFIFVFSFLAKRIYERTAGGQ